MICDELESKSFDGGRTAYELMEENGLLNTSKKVRAAIDELKQVIKYKEGVGKRWFARCMEARALWVNYAPPKGGELLVFASTGPLVLTQQNREA